MLQPLRPDDSGEDGTAPVDRVPTNATNTPELRTWQRYLILFIVSWNCLTITSTTTSLLVATPEIASSLHVHPDTITAANAAVIASMGAASLIWSPVSDIWSRRVSYNSAIGVLFMASVGTALAPNMATFMAMRVLTGLTGTYFMVAGQTIIADIFVPVVRGRAVGCMMVGSVAGSALGPCICGIIITYHQWRTMYWVQVGQAGLGLALSLLFVPRIKPEVLQLSEKEKAVPGRKLTPLEALAKFNCLPTLKLYARPPVLLADLACGCLAVLQYALLASIRHVINPRFNLTTPLVSGIFYLSPGVGFVVGSLVGGRFSDREVKRWIIKRNGVRLPKDRLNSGLVYHFAVLPIATLLYGWGLDKNFGGLALAVVMAFWIGVGLMGAWNGLNTYTAEVFPDQRAEVVCTKYLLQYALGAASIGTVIPLLDAASVGWSFTIFGILCAVAGVIVLYVARFADDKRTEP